MAYVPDDLAEAYVSQHVGLVRLKDPKMHRMIAAFLGPDGPGCEQIKRAQYGLKPGLSLIAIRGFQIPVLTPAELESVNRTISHLDSLRSTQHKHFDGLNTLQTQLINAFI